MGLPKIMPPTAVGSIQTSLRKRLPAPIDLLRGLLPGGGSHRTLRGLYHAACAGQGGFAQPVAASHSGTDSITTSLRRSAVEHRGESATGRGPGFSSSATAGSRAPFRPISAALLVLVRGYKLLISPLLPSACRFHPTCSCYMYGAIESHGPVRGIYLGVRRLLKCHPWHPGGIDLVPPQTEPQRTELHGR